MAYKKRHQCDGYAVRSINSMLVAINTFLDFAGWGECRVKCIRHQRKIYCAEDKELTEEE